MPCEVFVQSKYERAEKVISASHDSICDSVLARLALARTYCQMARSVSHPMKRRRLFTQACEALAMAEDFVRVAPRELRPVVLEDAERLRFEIRRLNAKASPD